jgi:ABC-type amino acid transport substrate-binding protein
MCTFRRQRAAFGWLAAILVCRKDVLMRLLFAALTAVLVAVAPALAAGSPTLDRVKKNGYLRCGVNEGLPGFASPDSKGNWTGMDVDFCRAVAAAIFNDPKKVRFTPTSAKVRFTVLQSGEVDLLSRNTTWTMSRDTQLGLEFVGVIYYDGQGFMVPKKLKVTSAKQLNGANVCTNTGTTTELNLADYFRSNGLKYKVIAFEKNAEVLAAYDAGRCDAYTTDASGLYAERMKLKKPDAVGRSRALDDVCAAQRRGVGRDVEERRPDAEIGEPGGAAFARRRRCVRRVDWALQRLGGAHRERRRQLRRGLRAHRGPGIAFEDQARTECALEQGRLAVRAAGAVIWCG